MKYKKSVYQSLVLITQFGINMIVPIFLCTGLGIFIDKKSGLGFFIIPLFILGALAGFRNCYIVAKKIYESDENRLKVEIDGNIMYITNEGQNIN